MGLTPERLRADADAFMEEVSREFLMVHSGLKPTAELQPIYERYARVLGSAALDLVRAEFEDSKAGSDAHRGARLMLEWEVESQTGRAVAEIEEREIAWESSAVVSLPDGRQYPYLQAGIEIANAGDRRDRLAIDEARASIVESGLVPIRRDRLQRERDFVESLGLAADYNAAFTLLSGIPLDDLVDQCRECLRGTEAVWGELLPGPRTAPLAYRFPISREPMRSRSSVRRSSTGISRARPWRSRCAARSPRMGIDPDAGGRVRYDTGERAGKRARAFCAPVRVPDEVYLVMRPHGGQTDYQTLLHELGHALHFAYTRADHPFEYRWVGDNSVTESYAMLFDHLMQHPGWLLRYSGLGKRELPPFLRAAALEELQFLRRYCAKLIYEVQLYGGKLSWDLVPDLYVETLTEATSFRYRRADAFIDVDSRYYAARYLRAWQLGALLAESLRERFNEDWYRNPQAGPWIVEELFAEGQRELADEIAHRVAGRALSFGPVIAAVERLVG